MDARPRRRLSMARCTCALMAPCTVSPGRSDPGGEAAASFPDDFPHHAQEVAAHDLLDILLAIAAFQQTRRDGRHLRHVFEPDRHSVDAIPIAPDADVIDAGHRHRMVDVRDRIFESRAALRLCLPYLGDM